jgi:hypothetical protein
VNRRGFLRLLASGSIVLLAPKAVADAVGHHKWRLRNGSTIKFFDFNKEHGWAFHSAVTPVRHVIEHARLHLPQDTPFEVRETVGYNYGREALAWYYHPRFWRTQRSIFNGRVYVRETGCMLRYRGWA